MTEEPKKLQLFFNRNDMYPWPWTLADEVLTREIADIADGRKLSIALEEYVNGHLFLHCDMQEMNDLTEHVFEKILNDETFFHLVVQNTYSKVDALFAKWEERVTENISVWSSDVILNSLEEYREELKDVRKWGWVPALIDGAAEPLLSNACILALREEFPEKSFQEINQIFSLLSTPRAFGEVQKSEIEKLKLIQKIGDEIIAVWLDASDPDTILDVVSMDLKKSLLSYVKRFGWVTYNYEGPTLSISLFRDSCRGLNVARAQEEISSIVSKHEEVVQKQDHFFAEHILSKKVRYVLELAQTFMTLKEYRKSVYQQSYILADVFLLELSKRFGIPLDELKFLSIAEMRKMNGDIGEYKDVAKKRRYDYSVVLVQNGEARYFDGDEARELANTWKEVAQKFEMREFHGQVAYPGKARGTARIILSVKDLSKMNEGDILISSSTNPDLLPAMKKAAAIVTEFGGITCHAAIVSRELHIPCVVGTKVALKVIKDGDMLEVDAERGIVIILEKADIIEE